MNIEKNQAESDSKTTKTVEKPTGIWVIQETFDHEGNPRCSFKVQYLKVGNQSFKKMAKEDSSDAYAEKNHVLVYLDPNNKPFKIKYKCGGGRYFPTQLEALKDREERKLNSNQSSLTVYHSLESQQTRYSQILLNPTKGAQISGLKTADQLKTDIMEPESRGIQLYHAEVSEMEEFKATFLLHLQVLRTKIREGIAEEIRVRKKFFERLGLFKA
jgi:hypothetical protein